MHLMQEFFVAYDMFDRGHLPGGRPWDEQPYLWIEVFQMIGGQIAAWQKEEAENIQRRGAETQR